MRQMQEKECDMEAIERSWGNEVQASLHRYNAQEMQLFLNSLERYRKLVLDKKISA